MQARWIPSYTMQSLVLCERSLCGSIYVALGLLKGPSEAI